MFKEEEEQDEEQVKKKEVENQERGRVMVVDTRYVLANYIWPIFNFDNVANQNHNVSPSKPQIVLEKGWRAIGVHFPVYTFQSYTFEDPSFVSF